MAFAEMTDDDLVPQDIATVVGYASGGEPSAPYSVHDVGEAVDDSSRSPGCSSSSSDRHQIAPTTHL